MFLFSRGFIKGQAPVKLTGFDHVEEHVSYKEVHFKDFYPPVKTSCSPAENGSETPAIGNWIAYKTVYDITHTFVLERNGCLISFCGVVLSRIKRRSWKNIRGS